MNEDRQAIPVRVLIVDDKPAKLTALAAALEGMDLEIVTAASGVEALHRLLERDFAAVLLDVSMPIMDGFETARMIRLRPRSAYLPIIFVTAEALADDQQLEGYEVGAVDYVLSPVLPQILRAKVAVFADLYRMHEQMAAAEAALEKLNEDLARKAAQLETANKDLEGFSYSVSHDLRAPLRAIDGFSRILLDEYGARLDDEGRRLLNVVRVSAARMNRLIDDILMFSRAGLMELELVEVDMEALVRSAWEELAPALGARNISFELKSLPRACGDHSALVQAVTNLLANAAKFTRPRDPAVIEVGGSADERECVYHVKDNGVGFDMRYAGKLFGVFQRLHGEDAFEGTGIGLAIVKRIVTKHGGRVWAEGKVNQGATFFFALPRREPCQGGKP